MADTTRSFDAAAYTANGTSRERVALPEATFDGTVHIPVMHQAVKAFMANQRQGNAATKTRGKVIGGNQKPWRQKGTGRARQGSIRAPNWVGGGTVFGPSPRSYAERIPKQVKALARKSAFNARAREGAVLVVDRFEYEAPRTARLTALIDRLGLSGKKVLILTDGLKQNLYLSGRNLPTVHVMPYSDTSTYHLLWSDVVVIEAGAIGQQLEPVAETEPEAKAKPKAAAAKTAPRKSAPKKSVPAKKAAASRSGEAAQEKPASRRSTAKKAAARKAADKKTSSRKPAAAKKVAAKKKPAVRKTAAKPKKKGE